MWHAMKFRILFPVIIKNLNWQTGDKFEGKTNAIKSKKIKTIIFKTIFTSVLSSES